MSLHSRVKSSTIQAVARGAGCSLPSPSAPNRWLPPPGRGTTRSCHQPHTIRHTGRVFEVLTPSGAGGNSLQKQRFKFGGGPEAKTEGAAAARRSSPEGASPAPAPPGAALPAAGPGRRGVEGEGGGPRPRAASSGWWPGRAPGIARR